MALVRRFSGALRADARAPRARIVEAPRWCRLFPRHNDGRAQPVAVAELERRRGSGRFARELGAAIVGGSLDELLIPINLDRVHWVLAVVDFARRRFEYYDSRGGACSRAELPDDLRLLVDLLHRLAAAGQGVDFAGWAERVGCWSSGDERRAQRQAVGGDDRGAWVCAWALAAVLGPGVRHLDVEDEQPMVGVRERILTELFRDALLL
jgi:hypothetical protein